MAKHSKKKWWITIYGDDKRFRQEVKIRGMKDGLIAIAAMESVKARLIQDINTDIEIEHEDEDEE